ncbi:MAG: TonB-dependent receptor [Vitreoscilla sp.]|nr:TonB-dependent receptor [Burkholderiales bacterium]MBP6336105.1 TonB-dependent receptor [Vitreoscilla sp.]MBP6673833.1 TonB-dependent receptor [Vitreoscilla sp.]
MTQARLARAQWWVVLVALGTGTALAQEPPEPPTRPEADAPQRVEVKGENSDTAQRRRESVAKQIYGREEIDKYADTSLSDVLKRLPGVNVSGGSPRMRGLGAGYTQVLVNGEPAPPGFSLDNLPPSQVERIEVSKGPTAEHSAQAVAGTINIILREAPRKRQLELRVGAGYMKFRPGPNASLTYGDRQGALSWTLPLSLYQWKGGHITESERVARDGLNAPLHTTSTQDGRFAGDGFSFSPRLAWQLAPGYTLNGQVFAQRNQFDNDGRTTTSVLQGQPPLSVDDRYTNRGEWRNLRGSLQWVRRDDDGSSLDAKLGAQASRSFFRTDVDGNDAAGQHTLTRQVTGDNREHGASSSGKYARPLWEHHSLALGWDVEQRQRIETRSLIDNGVSQLGGFDGEPFQAHILLTAAYVQDEWEISPQWSTYLGLRSERITTTSQGSDGRLQSAAKVFTPLWHLNYKLDPKGRDLVRASLTRSYKAPELSAMLGRPNINTAYPVSGPNSEISPDSVGNPSLQPELATGLDVAFEKYLAGGGMVSVSAFHRRITGLIRKEVSLRTVPWSSQQRWVAMPVNLAAATSTGIELEVKGRAGELMPDWFAPTTALNLRAALSVYTSAVDGIAGPDNRLESQQPWSLTLGADHALKAMPLTYGVGVASTPTYSVQQTAAQRAWQGQVTSVDVFALWAFSKQTNVRLAANNLLAPDTLNRTEVMASAGELQSTDTRRSGLPHFSATISHNF